ncbi:hypothetical protein [Burkholderia sp.]|uniref:hypothetical protein n=1 Tax=Burkholderia sp. TaxID=36773 RepID=UPI0025BA43BB|nr:hypothetical protein [Burkholderia sp.]
MYEVVVRAIRANDQVLVTVVCPDLVDVMNNGIRRQWLAKRLFCDGNMVELFYAAHLMAKVAALHVSVAIGSLLRN